MSDLELALRIKADLKQATREIKGLRKDLQNTGAKRAERDTRGMNKELDKAPRKMRNTGDAARTLRRAIGAIGFALMTREVIKATTQLQSIEARMRVAAGSAGEAGEMMDFVRGEAERLGLSLPQVAKDFSALAVAAKGTILEGAAIRDVFTGVVEASTAMGLSAEQTSGAITALEQIISKGKVSAEELRGQLGERIPGAFQAAARAMGVTTQELDQMLVNGELLAEDLLPALAKEWRGTFGPEAERMASGLRAEINRMSTAFFDLMAQDDGMPAASEAIREFTTLIKDPAFQENFETFISGLATLTKWAVQAASGVAGLTKNLAEAAARQTVSDTPLAKLDSALAEIKRIEGRINAIKQQPGFERNKALTGLIDRLEARRAELQEVVKTYKHLREEDQKKQDSGLTGGGDDSGDTGGGDGSGDTGGDNVDAIDKVIAKLKEQAETYGMTAEQTEIYRLKQLEASETDIKVAKQYTDAIARRREAAEKAKAAEEEEQRLLEERQRIVDQVDPTAPLKRELELIDRLREKWPEYAAAFDEAALQIHEKMDKLGDKTEETTGEMDEFATQAARNMQSAFADYLYDPFDEGLKGMVRGFVDTIRRMTAEALAAKALQSFFGAMGGSAGGGGIASAMFAAVQHDGGPAGSGPRRLVHPSVFAGARRYHDGGMVGLAPDEVPAILQTGEAVLSRDEVSQIEQQQTERGRLEVGLEDGLIARIIESDAGQQSLIKVTRRNKSAMNQAIS